MSLGWHRWASRTRRLAWAGLVLCVAGPISRMEMSSVQAVEAAPAETAAAKTDTGQPVAPEILFGKDNLVAWCIVPFDALKRGPEARAEMLVRLGLRHVAYDWREEHVASFEEEILAYKKHGLDYFAFWDVHPQAFELFRKHQLHPQIWKMIPAPQGETQEAKVESAAQQLLPLVKETRELGCPLSLYNHGGWMGEPRNMVAVCRWLREHEDADHVGIVYNFHHGHDHIGEFPQLLAEMLPYLHCLNINGMNEGAQPKILGVGKGQHDKAMLQAVLASGYRGRIGILDHRENLDAEESLRENLEGLAKLVADLRTQLP